MNLNSKKGLIERLSRGREARAQFVSSHLDKFISFQIRALRDQDGLSQTALAEKLDTTQNSISRLESWSKTKPTIRTLKKIAAVFDVGLEVRFVPFSKLINFVSGTPYEERGLSTDSYYVPSFSKDDGIRSSDLEEKEALLSLIFGDTRQKDSREQDPSSTEQGATGAMVTLSRLQVGPTFMSSNTPAILNVFGAGRTATNTLRTPNEAFSNVAAGEVGFSPSGAAAETTLEGVT